MERLSGQDSGFLSMELAHQPMMTEVLVVLRGPALGVEQLRAHMAGVADRLGPLRWRVEAMPGGLWHPVFVEDDAFDIRRHVGRRVLEAPGGRRELDRAFTVACARRLDRRHPLWSMTLLDGLADGGQALHLRYHHCLADGVAIVPVLRSIFGADPTPYAPAPGADHRTPPVRPGHGVAAGWREGLARVPGVVRQLRAAGHREERPEVHVTPLNALGAGRRSARVALERSAIDEMRTLSSCTFGDVLLTVLDLGCTADLERRGAPPVAPLVANVPVSLEPAGAPARAWGNRISGMAVTLGEPGSEPAERLGQIAAASRAAKAAFPGTFGAVVPDILELVPPWLARSGVRGAQRAIDDGKRTPDANLSVSHFRGEDAPYALEGAEAVECWIHGPPTSATGTCVTAWSYGSRVLIAVLGTDSAIPDPEALEDGIRDAAAELLEDLRARYDRMRST